MASRHAFEIYWLPRSEWIISGKSVLRQAFALLFVDVSQSNFKDLWDTKFVVFCVVATLISILLSIFFSMRLKDKEIQGEFIQACYRSSAALLGLALTSNIILGAVVLFVVVVLFLWVSSKHKESGLGDTCSGNCSSCSAHCSTGSKDKK